MTTTLQCIAQDEFQITDIARERIEQQIQKRGSGIGIRIGVRKMGCSGLAYTMEFSDEASPVDYEYMLNDHLSIFIDAKAFQYLHGATLDYQKKGLNEGFEFINPNEKGRCGCGESFTT